jgi:hypothetical protein
MSASEIPGRPSKLMDEAREADRRRDLERSVRDRIRKALELGARARIVREAVRGRPE